MKNLLFLSVIIVTFGIFASSLTNREEENFLSTYASCLKSSQVNIGRALQTSTGVIDNEPKLKEFLFCINKQNGVQDEKGNFLKDLVRERITSPLIRDKTIEEIVEKCTEKQETGEETAYNFLKCSHDTIMSEKQIPFFPLTNSYRNSDEKPE